MRTLGIVALGAALSLADRAESRQEVVAELGREFIGQNVGALVVQWGPPGLNIQNERRRYFLRLATG